MEPYYDWYYICFRVIVFNFRSVNFTRLAVQCETDSRSTLRSARADVPQPPTAWLTGNAYVRTAPIAEVYTADHDSYDAERAVHSISPPSG